ncbi:MAG: hypothetical protein ACYC44_00085 [Patescibacteria group bacterium]
MLMHFVREQARQAGVDIDAFLSNHWPWRIKQLKSLFSRRLWPLSLLIALGFAAYWLAVFKMEPELAGDLIAVVLAIGSVVGVPAFALWNRWNGRLRYTPLPATTAAQRAAASRAATQAVAAREAASVADHAFENRRTAWNPLTPVTPELINAALQASEANARMARAYRVAAEAEAAIHRAPSSRASLSQANSARDKLSRIAATVPDPRINGFFNIANREAGQAAQAAEAAMAEEDSRVFVSGFSTSCSLPHVWTIYVMAMLYAACLRVFVEAMVVGDSWLAALSYVPWLLAGAMIMVVAEATAWMWKKAVKAVEFVATRASWLTAILPGDTLRWAVEHLRIDLFDEEGDARFLREVYWSLCFFAPLPLMAVAFWIPNESVAAVVAAATVFGTYTAGLFMKRGKKDEVEANTTKVVGFFYNYGKWITVVVLFLMSASVEWDALMNRLVGITPVVVISGKPGWYVVSALLLLLMTWIMAKSKKLGAVAVVTGIAAVLCLAAPAVRAATGHEALRRTERSGPGAEKPVQMTQPVVAFRPMANGHKEMVITFYTVARQAKGVVRFDPELASQLGVDQEVQVKSFGELVNCGDRRCRQHEVRIPELTTLPHGSFTVVMRHWLSVEVGEQTFI